MTGSEGDGRGGRDRLPEETMISVKFPSYLVTGTSGRELFTDYPAPPIYGVEGVRSPPR